MGKLGMFEKNPPKCRLQKGVLERDKFDILGWADQTYDPVCHFLHYFEAPLCVSDIKIVVTLLLTVYIIIFIPTFLFYNRRAVRHWRALSFV